MGEGGGGSMHESEANSLPESWLLPLRILDSLEVSASASGVQSSADSPPTSSNPVAGLPVLSPGRQSSRGRPWQ